MKRKGKSPLWYCWLGGEKHVHLTSPKLEVKPVSWPLFEASPQPLLAQILYIEKGQKKHRQMSAGEKGLGQMNVSACACMYTPGCVCRSFGTMTMPICTLP